MKAITYAVLGIATAIVGMGTSVQAQSSPTPNSEGGASSLSGTSLTGVDNKTSEDDFSSFFGATTSSTTADGNSTNNTATPIRFNQTLSLPDTPIFLQPAQQSVNGNDGVQIQLDLRQLDQPSPR
jgi:hypothetical protein